MYFLQGCYDKFDRRQNSKGQDGLLITSADTVDKCKQACLASAACYGFDFSKAVSTPMCLIYNMEFVNDLTFNTQYDAYVRIRCTTPGTLTPTPGKVVFRRVKFLERLKLTLPARITETMVTATLRPITCFIMLEQFGCWWDTQCLVLLLTIDKNNFVRDKTLLMFRSFFYLFFMRLVYNSNCLRLLYFSPTY